MSIKKIGLIAGEGKLPVLLAQNAQREGIKIIAVGIKNKTEKILKKFVEKLHFVKLGELNRLVEIFKKDNIKKAVMAGKIPKVSIFDRRIVADKELKNLLREVKDKKDNSLLKAIADYLEENGIILLDSTLWLKNCLPHKGMVNRIRPTREQEEDINFGKKIAKNIASLDIGQTVVVKDKAVLSVEAMEHTDAAVKRGSKLGRNDVVVVKVSRPEQDMRFDVPVVGLNTIRTLKKCKAKALAVESEKTLFIDKEKIIEEANKAGISIVAF